MNRLIGEVLRESDDLLRLIRVEHQFEHETAPQQQRDAASEVRFVGDSCPWGKVPTRLGRVPAQHFPNADAAADIGQAIQRFGGVRRGETGEADVPHRHA